MICEILDLNECEEDQDLMDMDIEAVRETKTPAVICRYVYQRHYYCGRCVCMHSFDHCPSAPTH
ncbi:MAG: hypothetical protein LH614_17170 [Pyrinomonadaceae bacterium]|nr:hypothetical protein [Pyrinomonadaceae bacterium]